MYLYIKFGDAETNTLRVIGKALIRDGGDLDDSIGGKRVSLTN
jgi:hypothetical protein